MRRMVERHFRVYDVREERSHGQVVARLYYVVVAPGDFDARYEAARSELLAADREALVFLRREGGEDILFVAERPALKPGRSRTQLILFLATIVTTVTAGALYWQGYKHAGEGLHWSILWSPEHI